MAIGTEYASGLDDIFKRVNLTIGQSIAQMKLFSQAVAVAPIGGLASFNGLANSARGFGGAISDANKKLLQFTANTHAIRNMADNLIAVGKNWQWIGRTMTTTLTLPLLLGANKAIKQYLDYQTEIVRVQKAYASGPSGFARDKKDIESLVDSMGHLFAVSRTTVAGMTADWAAMGYSITKGVGTGLEDVVNETLRVGTLTETDLATAEKTVRAIQVNYARGLSAASKFSELDLTKTMANQLVAIADATSILPEQLTTAIPKLAQTAKQANLSFAQMAALIASVHDSEIPAEEAANALNVALNRLTSVKKAGDTLNQFKISLYDINGQRRPTIAFLQDLADTVNKLKGNDKVIDELFAGITSARQKAKVLDTFSTAKKQIDAIAIKSAELASLPHPRVITAEDVKDIGAFAQALVASGEYQDKYLNSGIKGLVRLKQDAQSGDKVAQGIIKNLGDVAETKLNNLLNSAPAKWNRLKSDIGATIIALGGALEPIGEVVLKIVNKITSALASIPKPVLQIIGVFGALLAAVGPIALMFGSLTQLTGIFVKVFSFLNILLGRKKPMEEITATTIGLAGSMEDAAAAATALGYEVSIVDEKLMAEAGANKIVQEALLDGLKARAEAIASIEAETAALDANIAAKLADAEASVGPVNFGTHAKTGNVGFIPRSQAVEETAMAARAKEIEAGLPSFPAGQYAGKGGKAGVAATQASEEFAGFAERSVAPGIVGGEGAALATAGAGAGAAEGGGLLASFGAMSLGPQIALIAALAAAVGVVVLAFKSLKEHWKAFYDGIKPGLTFLKDSLEPIKKIVMSLGEPFKRLASVGGGMKGSGLDKFWSNIGKFIGNVIAGIGVVLRILRGPIKAAVSILKAGLDVLVSVFKFIIDIISGDFVNAFRELGIIGATVFKLLIQASLLWLNGLARGISGLAGVMKKLHIPGAGVIKNFAKDMRDVSNAKFLDNYIKNVKNSIAADEAAEKSAKKRKKAQAPEKGGGGEEGGGGGSGPSEIDTELRNAIKDQMEKLIGTFKDKILKAFDAMAAARVKSIQDQIDAIDAQTKAEDDLEKEIEYNAKRQELLKKKQLDTDNYMRERTVALYEGKIDDVRMLDLNHQKNVEDSNKEIENLDKDHNRERVLSAREAAKAELQIQKDALDQQLKDRREALQAQLDEITKFAPKNAQELQKQMDMMAAVLINEGAKWEGYGVTATAAWAKGIVDATAAMADAAYYAGKTAYDNAVAGAGGEDQPGEGTEPQPKTSVTVNGITQDSTGYKAPSRKGDKLGGGTNPPSPYPKGYKSPTHSGPPQDPNVRITDATPTHHTGGRIDGNGDVPAILQSGEFVIQRSAVKKFGGRFFKMLNMGVWPKFHEGGIAETLNSVILSKISEFVANGRIPTRRPAGGFGGGAGGLAGLGGGHWQDIVAWLMGSGVKYSVGSTTGGQHVKNSWHYKGKAVDLHGDLMGIWRALAQHQSQLHELFYSPAPYGIKEGRRIQISDSVRKGHYNHVHAAIYDKGGLIPRGLTLMRNNTGNVEHVLTAGMINKLASGMIPLARAFDNGGYIVPRNTNSATAAAGGQNGAVTMIQVENFIGQEAWFKAMMEKYNVVVAPASDRALGATNRSISSYSVQRNRSRR